jgi:hypothetical protein
MMGWAADCCYYNHELPVPLEIASTFLFKWRDVHSGPFPGIGMEISLLRDDHTDDVIVELEGQDVTAVTVGNKTFEISIPFNINDVEARQKSLCDWRYGCAHCDHVAEEICGRRLSAISYLEAQMEEYDPTIFHSEILAGLEAVQNGLGILCTQFEESGGQEEYLTNDIVQTCIDDCLTI